jgi:hypothetical protein
VEKPVSKFAFQNATCSAKPRLFGYIDPTDPESAFKPDADAHDIDFEAGRGAR